MSQTDEVLRFLKLGRKLTAIEALRRFGTFRLAARILELRNAGWPIQSELRRFNGEKRVAVYSLSKGATK
jgi:hypothetical protein